MKQFNLEEYLNNTSRKVVTRDGRNARIICTDAKGAFPIVALIENSDGSNETAYKFKKNGYFLDSDDDYLLDLFFAPEKHEGWVNLYKSDSYATNAGCVFTSEKEAKESIYSLPRYVTTLKIEWEE